MSAAPNSIILETALAKRPDSRRKKVRKMPPLQNQAPPPPPPASLPSLRRLKNLSPQKINNDLSPCEPDPQFVKEDHPWTDICLTKFFRAGNIPMDRQNFPDSNSPQE